MIEYNVRMGDPETEVVMPRLQSDLLELIIATCKGELAGKNVEISPYSAMTLMMVAEGYPGSYEKGREILISPELKGVLPFHAGTKRSGDKLVTNGGRVLTLTGLGKNILEAMNNCYKAVPFVTWKGKNFRKDIGQDLANYN